MPLNTPAKNDRVERHLIRQRGAGVRTLTTSFGFSFDLPTSLPTVDHETVEEPPKKRRRIPKNDAPANSRESCPATKDTLSPDTGDPKISRRRFDPSDEDLATAGTPNGVHDRLVTTTKHRKEKKRKQRSDSSTRITSFEEPSSKNPATTGARPRRRAAENAKVKVTEGFAEEAAPIDQKRRDPVKETDSKRHRKKKVNVMLDGDHAHETKLHKRGKSEPTVHEGQMDAAQKVPLDDIDRRSERIPLIATAANRPRSVSPAKLTEKSMAFQSGDITNDENVKHSAIAKVVARKPSRMASNSPQIREKKQQVAMRKSSPKSTEPRARRTKTSRSKDSQRTRVSQQVTGGGREALTQPKQCGMGSTTIAATVLDKNVEGKQTEDEGFHGPTSRISQTKTRVLPTPLNNVDTSEAPSSFEERAENLGQTAQPAAPETLTAKPASRAKTDISDVHGLPRFDSDLSAPLPKSRTRPPNKKSRNSRYQDSVSNDKNYPKVEKKAEIDGEDVDWLFATRPGTHALSRRQVKTAPIAPRASRRALSDMPEMDLDDMLTGITSLVTCKKGVPHGA